MAKDYTTLTIKRTNGTVETVVSDRFPLLYENKALQARIIEENRKVGRGEVLSFEGNPEFIAERAARIAEIDREIAGMCKYYTRDQGCPLHGETCESAN